MLGRLAQLYLTTYDTGTWYARYGKILRSSIIYLVVDNASIRNARQEFALYHIIGYEYIYGRPSEFCGQCTETRRGRRLLIFVRGAVGVMRATIHECHES